jgi:hypothetical protein
VFISKSEYNHLQEVIQNQAKSMDGYNQRLIDEQDKYISFSTYYAERLEWWKKQFDKEPEPHRTRINTNDIPIWVNYNNRSEQIEEFDLLLKAVNINQPAFTITNDDGRNETILISAIVSIEQFDGHPEPYSDSEIESWAKEQLEIEMKNWKVVKEPPITAMEVVIKEQSKFNAELRRQYLFQAFGIVGD